MSVFVFCTKIFPETKRDVISSLPLELSWKIFSYLDDRTLSIACQVCKIWERIILSNKNLKRRLKHFDLAIMFGFYYKRAKSYKVNRTIVKKKRKCLVSSSTSTMATKRDAVNISVCIKRTGCSKVFTSPYKRNIYN